tara:strand:+ start:3093 stop:3734 length:642 start_codon:yes stop_codon:yes gene_type:complete
MYSVADKYTLEQIQELEALYPGPYLVYRVEEVNKVGATKQTLEERHIQMERYYKQTLSLPKVLFETNDLLMAAEKEREMKALYGIQWNTTDYIKDLRRQIVACSKKVRKKAMDNTDMKKKFNIKTRQRIAKANSKSKVRAYEVIEVEWIPSGRPGGRTNIIKKTKYFRTFKSNTAASRYFTNKGINISPADIGHIISPKYSPKSRHGYTFKEV